MTFENENHVYYIYRLIEKIKFQEIDEIELRDFVSSPWGTEILKKIQAQGKYNFIEKNAPVIPDRIINLILDRISNWEPSSKRTAREWDDDKTKEFLTDMIEPYQYTEETLETMTIELRKRISR